MFVIHIFVGLKVCEGFFTIFFFVSLKDIFSLKVALFKCSVVHRTCLVDIYMTKVK